MNKLLLYAWGDFFSESLNQAKQTKVFIGPRNGSIFSFTTPENAYVNDCLFVEISATSSGGAISVTAEILFALESSTFTKCSTADFFGGAVYFSTASSKAAVSRICSYSCICTKNGFGQFAYIEAYSAQSPNKNIFQDSSVTKSINTAVNDIINLNNYDNDFNSNNITNNDVKYNSAFFLNCNNNAACKYCTVVKNKAEQQQLLYFSTGVLATATTCNFISNYAKGNFINCASQTNFIGSCFLFNTFQENFFIDTTQGITFDGCVIDNGPPGCTTINTPITSFVCEIQHISCNFKIPTYARCIAQKKRLSLKYVVFI